MRATTQRMALLETLGKVKSAAATKHTVPVCSSVLVQCSGGQVTLAGTNLEVAVTASCKATVSRQGAIAVSPKSLEAFLKAAKADTVTLSAKGKTLQIEAGAFTSLEGFGADEFPKIEGVRGKAVDVTGLAAGLKQISYAMAENGNRPVLNGTCLSADKGKLTAVACDGFRLALTTVKSRGVLDEVVVPSRAVGIIERLMPGKVSICRDERYISFAGDGVVLTSLITQGEYPNYRQVIPKGGSGMTVDSTALKDAVKTVAVTLPKNGAIRLQTRGGNLIVSTKSDEKGETTVKVPAKGKAKIGFDAAYLKDLLARTSGPMILRTKNAQSPGVVKQNGTLHVIMPMHVGW